MNDVITILQAGNTVVTDLGRTRGPRYGLPVNGAMDQFAARAANILVANDDNAPLLEITALDFRMRPEVDVLISVTGSPANLFVGGREQQLWAPVTVRAGESVEVRGIHVGLRCYLAIHGSVQAPQLMGSCAPDTVIGFGLRLTPDTTLIASRTVAPIRQPYFDLPLFRLDLDRPVASSSITVDVTDGPDVDEFGDSVGLLFDSAYTVSERSNHIGLRLGGKLPERSSTDEILSRGVPVGAIEVPNREELLVLHRGRGVTAGYPVLAVVTRLGLDLLAQARPGDSVRFRKTRVAQATLDYQTSRKQLESLRQAVNTIFNQLGVNTEPHWRKHPVLAI